jgi:hypothetical protein
MKNGIVRIVNKLPEEGGSLFVFRSLSGKQKQLPTLRSLRLCGKTVS